MASPVLGPNRSAGLQPTVSAETKPAETNEVRKKTIEEIVRLFITTKDLPKCYNYSLYNRIRVERPTPMCMSFPAGRFPPSSQNPSG